MIAESEVIGSEGGRGSVMTGELSKTVSWSRMSDGVEDQIERISSTMERKREN